MNRLTFGWIARRMREKIRYKMRTTQWAPILGIVSAGVYWGVTLIALIVLLLAGLGAMGFAAVSFIGGAFGPVLGGVLWMGGGTAAWLAPFGIPLASMIGLYFLYECVQKMALGNEVSRVRQIIEECQRNDPVTAQIFETHIEKHLRESDDVVVKQAIGNIDKYMEDMKQPEMVQAREIIKKLEPTTAKQRQEELVNLYLSNQDTEEWLNKIKDHKEQLELNQIRINLRIIKQHNPALSPDQFSNKIFASEYLLRGEDGRIYNADLLRSEDSAAYRQARPCTKLVKLLMALKQEYDSEEELLDICAKVLTDDRTGALLQAGNIYISETAHNNTTTMTNDPLAGWNYIRDTTLDPIVTAIAQYRTRQLQAKKQPLGTSPHGFLRSPKKTADVQSNPLLYQDPEDKAQEEETENDKKQLLGTAQISTKQLPRNAR